MDRRRFLLSGLAGMGVLLASGRARAGGRGRKLLVYFNSGGWDPTFVFDPHFESTGVEGDPSSTAATVGGIAFADAASRPSVRRFFESYGATTAVINGIGVSSISHSQCVRLILTGSRSSDAADLPSLLAARIGTDLAMPYLVVSGPRYPGTLARYMVPLSHTLTATAQGTLPAGVQADPEHEALIRAFLLEESERLSGGDGDGLYGQYRDGLMRQDLLSGGGLSVPEDPTFDDDLASAITALSDGSSAAVMLQGDLPNLTTWDTHNDNQLKQDAAFEHTFDRLTDLIGRLESTAGTDGQSLLSQTTVVVLSEMGRTPLYNGTFGKDHWPVTSAMLVGAGVAGGQVVGATDGGLSAARIDLATGEATDSGETLDISAVLAGLLTAFDVDPGDAFPGVTPLQAPIA
ncbi:MAG: hypothetical protein ACI8RZ_005049 [Myxococcota bacterium]|jgi:hypothetical protein